MNIRKKVIGLISGLFMILLITVVSLVSQHLYKTTITQNGEKGLMVLRTIVNLIDVDTLVDVFEKGDMANPEYLNMEEEFTNIALENDLLYLYSVHYEVVDVFA